MTHAQKLTKWETAWGRYIAALVKFDAAHGKPGAEWNARRTLRAARENMERIGAQVS